MNLKIRLWIPVLKRIDRYLFKRLFPPFLLGTVGLLVFISLSLAIQLTGLLLGQDSILFNLLILLGLKIPSFLVFALPIALLFAVFMVFARLINDQEILAFQLGGYSLKRIVVPVLIFGMLVSGLGFLINNYLLPWSERNYKRTVYRLVGKEQFPRIQADLFFKGGKGRTFYIGTYNPGSSKARDIMIFDQQGLSLSADQPQKQFPELLTSKQGVFSNGVLRLKDGQLIVLNKSGHVKYTAAFEEMSVETGRQMNNLALDSRQPDELSVGELVQRIKRAQDSGLQTTNLRLALHTKFSLPLAGMVFALFSAPLSLLFRHRSRAVGIVLSIGLAGGYQGLLLWSRTLVNRANLSPIIGAWLPDVVFTVIGCILFVMLDRTHIYPFRKFWEWVSGLKFSSIFLFIILFGVLVVVSSPVAKAYNEDGISVRAEEMTISQDYTHARGNVLIKSDDWSLQCVQVRMHKQTDMYKVQASDKIIFHHLPSDLQVKASDLTAYLRAPEGSSSYRLKSVTLRDIEGSWNTYNFAANQATVKFQKSAEPSGSGLDEISCSGDVNLNLDPFRIRAPQITLTGTTDHINVRGTGQVHLSWKDVQLTASKLTAKLGKAESNPVIETIFLAEAQGQLGLATGDGDRQQLYFSAHQTNLVFGSDHNLENILLERARFSTCSCCTSLRRRPYSVGAKEIKIIDQDILLAYSVDFLFFGRKLGWLPFYFIPLQDLTNRPLFPEFGYGDHRGLYTQWSIPLQLTQRILGTLELGYFNKSRALQLGIDLSYRKTNPAASLQTYHLFSRTGKSYHRLSFTGKWRGLIPRTVVKTGGRFKRGALRGDQKKQSEWHVAWRSTGPTDWMLKASRKEWSKNSGQSVRALRKIPEFKLQYGQSLFEKNRLSLTSLFTAGYYQEAEFGGSSYQSSPRVQLAGSSKISGLNMGLLNVRLSGQLGLGGYFPSWNRDNLFARAWWGLAPTLSTGQTGQLNLSYDYLNKLGSSPFRFDRRKNSSKVSVAYQGTEGSFRHNFNLAIELGHRILPATYELSYSQGSFHTAVRLAYSLSRVRLKNSTVTLDFQGDIVDWELLTEYSFVKERFKRSRFESTLNFDNLSATLALEPNFNQLTLKLVKGSVNFQSDNGWGFAFSGTYHLIESRLKGFHYSIFRKIQDCLKFELTGNLTGLGFQASIVGFPGASLSVEA